MTPLAVGSAGDRNRLLDDVACTGLAAFARNDVLLIDQLHDGARNEVPFGIEGDRNHRLNVEEVTPPVVRRAHVAVVIELKRDADQRRDRVGELPGQVVLHIG